MKRALRVVVGADSFLVRQGICHVLDRLERVDVVGAEGDLPSLRDVIERELPDVVVTDVPMQPSRTDEGIRLAVDLAAAHSRIGVVILSDRASRSYAFDLFAGGAPRRAYLLKDAIADDEQLSQAIDAVASGRPWLDPQLVELAIGANREIDTSLEDLEPRELTVLALIARGWSNDAIAKELMLKRRRVERHISSIFGKLRLEESTAVNRRVLAALFYERTVGTQP